MVLHKLRVTLSLIVKLEGCVIATSCPLDTNSWIIRMEESCFGSILCHGYII